MRDPQTHGYSEAWQAGNIFGIDPPLGCPVRGGAIIINNEYGYNTGIKKFHKDYFSKIVNALPGISLPASAPSGYNSQPGSPSSSL